MSLSGLSDKQYQAVFRVAFGEAPVGYKFKRGGALGCFGAQHATVQIVESTMVTEFEVSHPGYVKENNGVYLI